MKKPKILLLSPVLPYPPTDGGRLRTYELCKALADKYDFTIIARVGPDDIRAIKGAQSDFLRKVTLIPVLIPGLGVRLSEGRKPGFFQKLANKFAEWADPWQGMDVNYRIDKHVDRAIKRCLKAKAFDLVHVEYLYMAQYVRNFGRIPAVLNEPDIESKRLKDFMRRPRKPRGKWITKIVDNLILKIKSPLQLRWVERFESAASQYFKLCVTVSEIDKERLQELAPTLRIRVVPNGVDTSYLKPHISESRFPTLVFTGHMGYFPNEDAVLYFDDTILPLVRESVPNVEFYVVGKQPSDKILQLCQKNTRVKVTGFVKDVRPYMASNFIYIVPLRIGSGTRIKILEAMAMKMAVVSTSVGCEGLEVEEGKNIVVADGPGDFAAKVVELIKNDSLRSRLGENARRLVEEKYDWRKIAEIQDRVYQECLEV